MRPDLSTHAVALAGAILLCVVVLGCTDAPELDLTPLSPPTPVATAPSAAQTPAATNAPKVTQTPAPTALPTLAAIVPTRAPSRASDTPRAAVPLSPFPTPMSGSGSPTPDRQHLATTTPTQTDAALPGAARPTPATQGPTVIIGDVPFKAELAITPAQRQKGLSGREALPPKTGMLFIFPSGTASTFWMREMRFPLDFVWISADCAVAQIMHDVPAPAPDTPLSELPTYSSASPAALNFEINAGEAARYGIAVGTRVRVVGLPPDVPDPCR